MGYGKVCGDANKKKEYVCCLNEPDIIILHLRIVYVVVFVISCVCMLGLSQPTCS